MLKTYKGIVQEGSKKATELGFPTVNMPLSDVTISGVYVARVEINNIFYKAAAFADQSRKILEAHMLDGEFDLYGKEVTIELLHKIRDSKVFTDNDSLKRAIADDVEQIRAYFRTP